MKEKANKTKQIIFSEMKSLFLKRETAKVEVNRQIKVPEPVSGLTFILVSEQTAQEALKQKRFVSKIQQVLKEEVIKGGKVLASEVMAAMPLNFISKQQFIGFFEFMSKNQFWTTKIKTPEIENLFSVWTYRPSKRRVDDDQGSA